MATSKEYRDYILEQFAEVGEVTCRAMMGECLLYYRGRLFGGIYDNRLLIKPVAAAKALLPDASEELPYEGAKPMFLVEDTENKAFLKQLLEATWDDLPAPKKKDGK